MRKFRFMLTIRAFGKLALLSATFLLGVFATAMFAAILDSAASPSPTQQPPPVALHEQTSSDPQPAVEQHPAINSESETKDSDAWPDIPPLALSQNRTLLTRGSTLHMLDAKNQVVWSWSAGDKGWPFITDQPIVDSSGTIYVVGMNLTHVALDVASGREKWGVINSSGRYAYRQIEKYIDDQYLILSEMTWYDIPEDGDIQKNFLAAYKGKDILWSTEFPRGAELLVREGKIYAVIYNEGGVETREILPDDEEFSCSC